jgi:ABC-2 type transport system permease protein
MSKILEVARRDFLATVTTKGFVITLLFPPIFYALAFFLFPRLISDRAPRVTGQVAIIDATGQVSAGLKTYLSADAISRRRQAALDRARDAVMPGSERMPATPASSEALAAAVGQIPNLEVVDLAGSAELSSEKDALKRSAQSGGRLGLVVVHPDAVVRREASGEFGTYEFFVRANLDDRIQREIMDGVQNSIVDARVRAEGLDRRHLDALTTVVRPRSVTVTERAESEAASAFTRFLPVAFMILLIMSVMVSGQHLMTTTIEEKSSRTMEVILSAVSPMELMAGKILAQLCVGLVVLCLYSAAGLLALFSMALLGFLDLTLLAYLVIFFLTTYLIIGSLMAAIGSAVNELREAQALMLPITMSMMTPWLLWYPISRDPNSTLAITLSFLPPMNAFAMLLRLTSSVPPPLWQVWLSIAVGVLGACAALWFAARVFKIGLLMYGRPPDFATLIRWVRQG